MVQTHRPRSDCPVQPRRLGLIPLVLVVGLTLLFLLLAGSTSHPASARVRSASSLLPALPGAGSCAPSLAFTVTSNYDPMGMAYDAAHGRLFIANQNGPGNLLIVFTQHHVYLPVIFNAWRGMSSATGYAGPENVRASTVQSASWPITKVVPGLPGARSVAYDATRNRIYVGGGNAIYIVDGVDYSLLDTFHLSNSTGIFALAYNPRSDTVYATDFDNSKVKLIDAAHWVATDLNTSSYPLSQPAYIAVNTDDNKVYISNHHSGTGPSWVTVINGVTNQIETNIYLSGDSYGIAVDMPNKRVYVTSISEARVYAINSKTNEWIGDIQIKRASDGTKVPLRMVGVNPTVGSSTHVWLTSAEADAAPDLAGMDKLIVVSFDSATGWPPATPSPVTMDIGRSSIYGLVVDPTTGKVFVSSTGSNLLTVAQDGTVLCSTPLALSGAELVAVVETH